MTLFWGPHCHCCIATIFYFIAWQSCRCSVCFVPQPIGPSKKKAVIKIQFLFLLASCKHKLWIIPTVEGNKRNSQPAGTTTRYKIENRSSIFFHIFDISVFFFFRWEREDPLVSWLPGQLWQAAGGDRCLVTFGFWGTLLAKLLAYKLLICQWKRAFGCGGGNSLGNYFPTHKCHIFAMQKFNSLQNV